MGVSALIRVPSGKQSYCVMGKDSLHLSHLTPVWAEGQGEVWKKELENQRKPLKPEKYQHGGPEGGAVMEALRG